MMNRLNGPLQKRGTNTTGIQEAVSAKKEIKRMKKINMIADGYVLGEMKSKMMGMDED